MSELKLEITAHGFTWGKVNVERVKLTERGAQFILIAAPNGDDIIVSMRSRTTYVTHLKGKAMRKKK